jgi:predicted MFS family arabinose efflux permease
MTGRNPMSGREFINGQSRTNPPAVVGSNEHNAAKSRKVPDGNTALYWACLLCSIPLLISLALGYFDWPLWWLIGGLLVFGAIFAVNSSLHSYLIVSYAGRDGVSLDVGFYYMANAMGRLIGTLLSGWLYQAYGLSACLWVSSAMLLGCVLISIGLPPRQTPSNQ